MIIQEVCPIVCVTVIGLGPHSGECFSWELNVVCLDKTDMLKSFVLDQRAIGMRQSFVPLGGTGFRTLVGY